MMLFIIDVGNLMMEIQMNTVKPVYNDHPRDQTRINHKAGQANCLRPTRKKGSTKIKNDIKGKKGAYETLKLVYKAVKKCFCSANEKSAQGLRSPESGPARDPKFVAVVDKWSLFGGGRQLRFDLN